MKLFVVAVCFCFGGGGPVSFRAVKGKGGESALEFGGGVVVGFGFGAGGGPGVGCETVRRRRGAGCETVRRRRLFLFWGGRGARSWV